MKEIDTEAPVVWPAWCYSGNITTDILQQSSRGVRTSSFSSSSPSTSSSPEIVVPETSSCKPNAAVDVGSVVGVSNKLRSKRKSHSTNKQFTESVDDINIGQNHQIVKRNKETIKTLSPPLMPDGLRQHSSVVYKPQKIKSKASVQAFHSEKMLSDRMLLSGYNAIESNKQLCDSSSSAYLFLEKVKNETQMESLKDTELANNNNVNSSNNNNNPINSNNNNNNNIISNNNSSGNCSTNNTSSVISNNNSNSNSNTSNNSVKRERLSPGTNGDAQFSLSRSRSATPSSFRGTPPQTVHPNNDLQLHNLSTNLLTQIQNRSSDFSTRNYSDFMRSLAAKYNNSNPNDSGTSRRNPFFENNKISQPIKSATNSNTNNNGSSLKEQSSPSESVKSAQNIQNLTTSTPSVPPFVQTFLSSLPFSPGVFPPLIDMSSTQALVTLARAAKEAEIKNILMSAQKRTSLSNNTTSSSPGPNLTAALQQAAQFASPALLYSAQLQQQQQQQQSQNRQSSPNQETSANSSGEKHMTASPLDLSSAPPTKRYKAESTSSGGSDKSPNPDNLPGPSGVSVATPTSSPSKVKTTAATTVTSEASVIAATTTSTPVLPLRQCQAQSDEVNAWTVEDVCTFVGSIDICVMYVKNFREQCIDGSGLPLLTEDHLMNQLGMKLGPALKLKSMLAKKLGGPCPCVSCSSQAQLLATAQAAAVTVATSSTSAAVSTPPSGITGKNQLHPQEHQQTQQLNARNSATCNSSISHTTVTAAAQRKNSCCSSIPRPSSADSGS